jgi:hypothetical protein
MYTYEHDTGESLKTFFKSDILMMWFVIIYMNFILRIDVWQPPAWTGSGDAKFFCPLSFPLFLILQEKRIFFVSHPIPPFTYLRLWWHSAWGRCIAIILQASYPCDSDDTKWHRRLILSIFLDGDCIPLSFSTRITMAEASRNESTVFPADRFFYTKALRLYSKMDIQVHNIRNRDVKGDDACSLL